MKICMIGAGYVGLVSGSCFADLGNSVWCVDKNKERIDLLNTNQVPFFEPGLKELVNKNKIKFCGYGYFGNKRIKLYRLPSKNNL